MDRYERILALHRSLKTARYPVPIKRLMEELACSRATLYRDIAFLRDALGAPVESEGEGSIRYDEKEAERFELPGLWLNSDELHALLAAHRIPHRGEAFGLHAEHLRARLQAGRCGGDAGDQPAAEDTVQFVHAGGQEGRCSGVHL